MANSNNNQTDEFVRLLAKNDYQGNFSDKPSNIDEIIFRDEDGELKVLKDGQIVDLEKKSGQPAAAQTRPADNPPAAKPVVIPPAAKQLDLEPVAEEIVKKANLNLADQQAQKRLKNIILLRLKDVRDQMETREILLASPSTGGMGFDTISAQNILRLAGKHLDQLDNKLRRESETIDEVDQAQEASAKEVFEPAAFSGVQEVEFTPKLVGPLEEIRLLNLDDFHKFSPDPAAAAERILEKINSLEQESFAKKIAAIKAWRQSELFRIYLKIGQQSLESNQPVSSVIAEAANPLLTEKEFNVISRLNSSLNV